MNITSMVPSSAFCASRLIEETNTPATSDTKSAFTSARHVFQNAAPVTPPIKRVMPTIGNAARSM